MYLKNLTVFGFKSFADKTSLNFQPGVTAIVGPNGCGKSNVSDAIRWVLGEQSAKALRGGEMADVIFTGTDGRKPLGMAEVSLTIGGVDSENLKAAGVEVAYNEVTLTRRVFKDGGSEYFINKVACRLKDIQQLFMGTGVGRTSYSIMAQGNITQLLSSKPEDRRVVFEEAAGITKFKSQKKEALRKLEYTDQNLLRVNDLIREVKRQIGSLQRQAGKARRYKQLMMELQHLDTQLARHEFDQLQTEIHQREETVTKLRVEIDLCSEGILKSETDLAKLRERLTELEQEVHTFQQQALEVKNQCEKHDSRIHFNEERMRELESTNSKALSDITQAEERRMAAESELREVSGRLTTSTQILEEQRGILRSKQEALLKLEGETRQRQEALKQAQARAFEAAQQLTRVRNEINALDMQKQGNLARLEKLSAEKIQLEEERGRLEARLAEFQQNVEAEKLNVQASRGSVEDRQVRLRQLQQEMGQATHELDAALQQQAEKRSRLNVLEQLQAEHQGFSAGALAALKQSQHVIGSLADRLRVPDQYVAAVEVALGHHLQLVLTEQPEAAEQILGDLRDNKRGRASVASLALLGNYGGADEAPPVNVGTVALSIIEADASVQSLLRNLLGQTLIVPTLADATKGWRETGGKFDFVTQTGDLLTRQGVYTGGYLNGSTKAPASILGRKNQIAELKTQSAELHAQVSEASRRKGSLQSEQTMLQASLQEAQTELRAQEVAMATRQGELNALHNSQRLLHQKIETVIYEIQSLAAQEQEGERKRTALNTRLQDLEKAESRASRIVADLGAELEGQRVEREQANASLTETKVALATEEQLCNSFRDQKRPLEQRIEELTHLVQQRNAEISSVIERRGQATREIEESRRLIASLNLQREELNNRAADLAGQKDLLAADTGTQEESLRDRRRVLSDLQQRRGQIEIELAQKNMAVQNLRQRVLEKWQVNLADIRSECITITIADEGPAKVHTLTPEEMTQTGAATDWNAVGEQVVSLQKRIEEMGPVNLVAIEEYEETEQRHKFLSTQYDDLVKAKEQLLDIINTINAQTKEMFTVTFNKIRDNFRAMFVEVFGGGKADLILVNEGDVLESGIDIVARPPGKQLQSITLLSGGEQTMTAVSLLFSIYQVKPSPFCVLDELDAPLDESNINRFVRILQRFLAHSQFIIITHNKRTIGMADVLYGVTMEEHGISKIVSVKFHKGDEPPSGHRPEPLVPPPQGPTVDIEEDARHTKEDTVEVMMAK